MPEAVPLTSLLFDMHTCPTAFLLFSPLFYQYGAKLPSLKFLQQIRDACQNTSAPRDLSLRGKRP